MAIWKLKISQTKSFGISFFLKILLGVLVLFSFINLVNICWKMCVAGAFGRVKSGIVANLLFVEKNETLLQLKRWSS